MIKFNQEDFLFIHLSPSINLTMAIHFLPLHLTKQILPQKLSASHISAVKLKTILLSVAVSLSFQAFDNPPLYHPPPC